MNIVIVPEEVLQDIVKTNKEILERLDSISAAKPLPDVVTKEEFMERAKIGISFLNDLIAKGKIRAVKYGQRLVRIPYSELLRFQRGEVK